MARSTVIGRAAAALGAVAVAVVGLAAGLAEATPSAAARQQQEQPQPPQQVRTMLVLAVIPQDQPTTVAVLTCEPAGGTHPEPAAACRDLTAAGGDFTKLPGDPFAGACPDVWQPVTATAFGWWQGRLTWYSRVYGNLCELQVTTGPVFPTRNVPRIDASTT